MAKKPTGADGSPLKYERVSSEGLKSSRRGKHNELIGEILNELETLPGGSAMKIPLDGIGELDVPQLRSAIVRGTAKHGIKIETSSDEESFYVWTRHKQRQKTST